MNKKILIFVGSNNKASSSNKFTEDLSKDLGKFDVEIETLFLHTLDINYCIGCRCCFNNGFCIFDKLDDIILINEKIKQNDIIIFISPVYVHDVPGKLKSVFDRLAYKMHLLEYAGKLGFTITTTFASGSEIVSSYLKKIQINFGMYNIMNFEYIEMSSDYDFFINNIKNQIMKYLNNDIDIFSETLEIVFLTYKNAFTYENKQIRKEMDNFPKNEFDFWNRGKIQKMTSFRELDQRKKNKDFSFEEDEMYLKKIKKLVSKI